MKFVIPESVTAKINGLVSRGVKAVEVDENGDLYFTLTDGSVINLGSVLGPGSSLKTYVEGDTLYIESDDNTYQLQRIENAEGYFTATTVEGALNELYAIYAVDKTLSIEGKAADAKATGNAINDVIALIEAKYSGDFDVYSGNLAQNIELAKTQYVTPSSSYPNAKLPKAVDDYAGQSAYFANGTALKGVLYSSVHFDGKDTYWNITPNTFFSAAFNPTSVLYDPEFNSQVVGFNSHRGPYYGGVCSSCATYMTGAKFPYRVDEIKDENGPFRRVAHDASSPTTDVCKNACIDKVEVGDLLCGDTRGHTEFISKVETDANGDVVYVEVSEQTTPTFWTKGYLVSEFKSTMLSEYSVYKYKSPSDKNAARARAIRRQPKLNYATDIQYKYGNDTYRDIKKMAGNTYFYIPEHSGKAIKLNVWKLNKMTGAWEIFTGASYGAAKNVPILNSSSGVGLHPQTDETTGINRIYNLRSVLGRETSGGEYEYETGDYKLGIDVEGDTRSNNMANSCLLKLISTGTITITPAEGYQKFILKLDGYENCAPVWFRVIKTYALSAGQTQGPTARVLNVPSGYNGLLHKSSYVDVALDAQNEQVIDMSSIVNGTYTYAGFMLQVMYDTGVGLAMDTSAHVLFSGDGGEA